jgi:peptidoglycan/LPS O-acetylase OafA/YrhL
VSSPPAAAARLNNITAARFLAALLVFAHHADPLHDRALVPAIWLRRFFANGYVGVTFFFVLSGFVIALVHYEEFRELTARTSFVYFAKRLIRIVPVWLFLSLPFLAADIQAGNLWPVLPFVTFMQSWSADINVAFAYLAVAWTLSCEMFFYACFPLLAWLLHRAQGLWRHSSALLIVVCVLAPLVAAALFVFDPRLSALPWEDANSGHRWLYRFPPMRFFEFALGVALYVVFAANRQALTRRPARAPWVAALLGAVAVLISMMTTLVIGNATFTAVYIAPFAVIVIALTAIEVNEAPLSVRLPGLILLGEASYSFYLVHQQYRIPPTPLQTAMPLPGVLWTACFTAILSVGLYMALERPTRRWLLGLLARCWPVSQTPETSVGADRQPQGG